VESIEGGVLEIRSGRREWGDSRMPQGFGQNSRAIGQTKSNIKYGIKNKSVF